MFIIRKNTRKVSLAWIFLECALPKDEVVVVGSILLSCWPLLKVELSPNPLRANLYFDIYTLKNT